MAELHLLSPRGFRASGVYAGLKSTRRPDVGLLISDTLANAAAAFTTNKVFAAPIKIGRNHIASGRLSGVVVNSGNANACTGEQGEKDAIKMCKIAGSMVMCPPEEILPSSTGIIGHPLPMEKVEMGIREAGKLLGSSREHALMFMDAILTTDLKRKEAAVSFKVGKEKVVLAGVCKGSGMIGPRMAVPHATMLGYLTTDAKIPSALLRKLMKQTVDESFNCVTVDDHTSTNDTVAILASGISSSITFSYDIKSFAAALKEVCQSLAKQIAADGEGATKVVRINVIGAKSDEDARTIARAIAVSPLVKCAMHGNDPNWGRIVSAAGLAGIAFNPDKASFKIQNTLVFKFNSPREFDAARLSKSLNAPEVVIDVNCRLGEGKATFWTCDLSKDYVTINADYHT